MIKLFLIIITLGLILNIINMYKHIKTERYDDHENLRISTKSYSDKDRLLRTGKLSSFKSYLKRAIKNVKNEDSKKTIENIMSILSIEKYEHDFELKINKTIVKYKKLIENINKDDIGIKTLISKKNCKKMIPVVIFDTILDISMFFYYNKKNFYKKFLQTSSINSPLLKSNLGFTEQNKNDPFLLCVKNFKISDLENHINQKIEIFNETLNLCIPLELSFNCECDTYEENILSYKNDIENLIYYNNGAILKEILEEFCLDCYLSKLKSCLKNSSVNDFCMKIYKEKNIVIVFQFAKIKIVSNKIHLNRFTGNIDFTDAGNIKFHKIKYDFLEKIEHVMLSKKSLKKNNLCCLAENKTVSSIQE